MKECQLCNDAGQYEWRLKEVEMNVEKLNNLLIGTLISSIGTLVGVLVLIFTK